MAMYENTKARDATVKRKMRRKDQPRILSGVFVGPSFAESLASFGKKTKPLPQRQPVSK